MFICHNGTSLATSQALVSRPSIILKRRASSLRGTSKSSLEYMRRRANSQRSPFRRGRMGSPPSHSPQKSLSKDQLWNPHTGIRFAPNPDVQVIYPGLNMTKFTNSSGRNAKAPKLEEEEYFSDNEEFEHFAAEWYDRQDQIASRHLPPKSTAEALGLTSGIPEAYAAKPVYMQKSELAVVNSEVEKLDVVPDPPDSACDFKIDKELFEKAFKSAPDTPESFWSYTMYKKIHPEGNETRVKLNYCTSRSTMEYILTKFFLDEKVLGFDLEWSSSATSSHGIRENVSLIQISSPSRIALFHVALFPKDDFTFPALQKIMEDEDVIKVGVHIQADCTRLGRHTSIKSKGLIELSHLYKLVKHSKEGNYSAINRRLVPLATQTKDFLGLPLYKEKDVRTSNWSRGLNNEQLGYAANDAYAGLQLYHVLEAERLKLDPCPPRPEFTEKGLPIQVAIPEEEVEEIQNELDSDLDSEAEILAALSVDDNSDEIRNEASTDFGSESSDTSSQHSSAITVDDYNNKREHRIRLAERQLNFELFSRFGSEDARVLAAKRQTMDYILSEKEPYSVGTPYKLIFYFLWYDNPDTPISTIRKLFVRYYCENTEHAAKHIFKIIVRSDLPYDETRLKVEVLPLISQRYMNRFVDELTPRLAELVDETERSPDKRYFDA